MCFFSVTDICTGDFAPLEPEFRAEFWETNFGRPILDPNSWVEFFDSLFLFQQKRPPEKFTVEKFTSQNSPSKIQPRNRAKKFTLHLCRAIWLTFFGLVDVSDIFYFFCSGGGQGEFEAAMKGGGSVFFIEDPRGGGSPKRRGGGPRGREPQGPGGYLRGIWGGGGGP